MQRIPITFQVAALPEGYDWTPQVLFQKFGELLEGYIDSEISFFTVGSVPPGTNEGIFINTDGVLFNWSTSQGKYIPSQQFGTSLLGDIKASFASLDHKGWFGMDGRNIDDLATTPDQKEALEGLFGVGGKLPDLQFLAKYTPNTNFPEDVIPAEGDILASGDVSATYLQADIQNLATAVLNVRTMTQNIRDALTQSPILDPNPIPALKWFVFSGTYTI